MNKGMQVETVGRDSWKCGALEEWCGNLMQWKLPEIYDVVLVRTFSNGE